MCVWYKCAYGIYVWYDCELITHTHICKNVCLLYMYGINMCLLYTKVFNAGMQEYIYIYIYIYI
jgi:hypothetical protein